MGDVRWPAAIVLRRFRAVPAAEYANAVVVLYATAALLGAIVYLYFKVDIQPDLERDRRWHALGFFDLKEDFVAIGRPVRPIGVVGRPMSGER